MMYFYRLNGVDSALYYGPTISSSSYTTYGPTEISTDFDYDPGTDDLEVGMVYYSGTGELKVSKLGVVVEY